MEVVTKAKKKPSEAKKVPEAAKIALKAVGMLAVAPKVRLAATSSGYAFALRPSTLDASGDVVMSADEDGKFKSGIDKETLVKELMTAVRKRDEQAALFWGNVVFVVAEHGNMKKVLSEAWKQLVELKSEQQSGSSSSLSSSSSSSSSASNAGEEEQKRAKRVISCLHELSQSKEYGSARLCFFQALLLRLRHEQANWNAKITLPVSNNSYFRCEILCSERV